jgi:uncharacterized membrane protein HdeD (DUF308 family)
MIIGGIFCMATPLSTYMSTGFYVGALLLVYGISGLIRSFQQKAGVLPIVVNALAIVVGIFAFIRPGQTLEFDRILLYVISAFYVIQGIMSIVLSIQVRNEVSGWWIGLIAGILGVILGIYSFAHPLVTAVSTGILIGLYFIESGISMIALGWALRE